MSGEWTHIRVRVGTMLYLTQMKERLERAYLLGQTSGAGRNEVHGFSMDEIVSRLLAHYERHLARSARRRPRGAPPPATAAGSSQDSGTTGP